MPKYRLVKTLLVTELLSGTGVVESLALDHAPLTIIVSFGTTFLGLGLVTSEKSPPLLWPDCGAGWGAGWTGAFWAGAFCTGALWIIWPQAGNVTKRVISNRKPEHLDCILLPSEIKLERVAARERGNHTPAIRMWTGTNSEWLKEGGR